MYKQIIIPKNEYLSIHIPVELINKRIELTIQTCQDEQSLPDMKLSENEILLKKTSGILSRYQIDPIEWQKEIRNDCER